MKCFIGIIGLAGCVLMLVMQHGCSRPYYRTKADNEIYSLLQKGAKSHSRWEIDDYRIKPKTHSRMNDPYCPDREPMPNDDPAAHLKMHYVDGKRGSKHWHDNGQTTFAENPNWLNYLERNPDGAVALNKETAVDLALVHSPEYQSAKENLFMAAMNVSQERFRFDVQFFGGDSLFYTADGRLRGTTLQNDAAVNANLLFATGGELVTGLANSMTWNFSGKDTWGAESILNISIVQPLLRGAGRKVVLEKLTQSERNFLAAIRQMVFFQQGYYTKIVTGSGGQSAPSGSSGASFTPSYGRGFYGLLVEQIRIQNQRQNIVGSEENLNRFIEIFEAGLVSDVYQVEEMRQSVLASESSLLNRINQYEANVETYVRSLGLPPDLVVDISDQLMNKFQLTSRTLTKLQVDVNTLSTVVRKKDQPLPEEFRDTLKNIVERSRDEIGILNQDLDELKKIIPERIEGLMSLKESLSNELKRGERIDKSVYDIDVFQKRIKELQEKDIPRNIVRLEAAFVLLDTIIKTDDVTLRKQIREKLFQSEVLNALNILKLNDTVQIDEADELLLNQKTLEKQQDELQSLQKAFDQNTPSPPLNKSQKIIAELRKKDEYRDWIRRVISAFQYELVSLSLMQTRTRLEAITIDPVLMTPEQAFREASENRLDWMNRKAMLTDAWRQVEMAAHQLKGVLDLTLKGEIGTIDQNGINFNSDSGSLSAGLKWDSPLTRHQEMLDYRRSQIAYQQARRDYYTYVDSVNAELRNTLRNIQSNLIDFEIARNAILVNTVRVDVMQLQMEQPPQRGQKIDTNTASQLISALNGLMNSQNDFLDYWVSYQTQRMLLDLNMGTMKLDHQGRWIDPHQKESQTKNSGSAETTQSTPLKFAPTVPALNKRYTEE